MFSNDLPSRSIKLAVVAALGVATASCADGQYGTKEAVGTLGGAALGGLAGSAIAGHGDGRGAGIILGVLVGGLIGNQIGKGLDKADRLEAERAAHKALERGRSGEQVTWNNPDTGHSGYIVPKPAYKTDNGQVCREYQQTVTIGGKSEQAYGTACRQPDGSWKVQS